MKSFLLFILVTFSQFSFADLRTGDVARYDYQEAAVYKIRRVTRTIVSETAGGETYYTARLRFHVLAEGNTCGGLRSTLGTAHRYVDDDHVAITLLTGSVKENEMRMCAEYSKPVTVVVPEVLDLGTSESSVHRYDFGKNYVVLKWAGRRLTVEIHNAPEK